MGSYKAISIRSALVSAALLSCQSGGNQPAEPESAPVKVGTVSQAEGRILEASLPMGSDPVKGRILGDIASNGWAVHTVPETEEMPGYAYTVGLYPSFQHPEVCLFGLPPEQSQVLLNLVGEEARAGTRYGADQTTDALADRIDFIFRDFPKSAYKQYLEYGLIIHDSNQFPTLQLVYPDRLGKYPWESGASAEIQRLQPLARDLEANPLQPAQHQPIPKTDDLFTQLEYVLSLRDLELTSDRIQALKGLTKAPEASVRAAAIALLYDHDPASHWEPLLATFSVPDYKQRTEGGYNMVGSQEFTDRLNAIQAGYGPGNKKFGPLLLAFLEYQDKNQWLLTNSGERISIARFTRGSFLEAVVKDPARVQRVCNKIDRTVLESMGFNTND